MSDTNGHKAAAPAKGKRKGLSKMEVVRQALAKLGGDAKPIQLRDAIKESFGMELKLDLISTYKGEILRKLAQK